MKRIFKIVALLFTIVVIAIVVLPFIIPIDTIKNTVLAKIEAATGRKVGMGKISLSVFPDIALKADDVTINNPAWAGGGNMADIKTLRIGVELMPLLHKQVYVKEFTLEEPVITLIKNGAQANWQLAASESQANKQAVVEKGEKISPSQAGNSFIPSHVIVKGGKVTYKDLAAHTVTDVSDINLELKAPDLAKKADLSASTVIKDKKIDIALELGKPLALMEGSASDVDMKLTFGDLKLTWLGTLSLPHNVPSLTGKIHVPVIDVTDFSNTKEEHAAAHPSSATPGKSGHWSDAPINLTALNSANANLIITIDKLVLPKTQLQDVQVSTHLAQGHLMLATNNIAAYGGIAKLALGATSTNQVDVLVNATNIQAEPLLQDFASSDRLSGMLDGKLSVTAIGASERAMIESLTGDGNFNLKDGKFKGANIGGMIRNLATGASAADTKMESTNFAELSGTFTIRNGIISNNDLKMSSPLLRMSGAGTADLPNWQVQYLLQPKIVATTQAESGKDVEGITVPVRVEGPLDSPRYRPDLQAALKENLRDPKKLKENVQQLRNNLGGTLQGILR